jgi:hypothetical protein
MIETSAPSFFNPSNDKYVLMAGPPVEAAREPE